MLRGADGEIESFTLRRFRSDGQVSLTYEYDQEGRLKFTTVHRYDANGEWQIADKYDITDRWVGAVSTRPSGYTRKLPEE